MMKTITVETLFGPEQVQVPRKPIRFKQIKVVMETLEVREDVAEYLPPDRGIIHRNRLQHCSSF